MFSRADRRRAEKFVKALSKDGPQVFGEEAWMRMAALTRPEKASTPTVPLGKEVRWLIESLVPGGQAVFVPFTQVSPLYMARFCQLNTNHRVKNSGGGRVDGWMIWEHRNFAEAEAHSLWRDLNGELVDLTPRVDSEAEVLFLPDPSAKVVRVGDQDRLLNTRTSVPGVPYVSQGIPQDGPYDFYTYPADGRKRMMKMFGFDTAAHPEGTAT